MKIILIIALALTIILKNPTALSPCNFRTVKQDLPPKIFYEQKIDGPAQSTLVTRFFHNKIGITLSEVSACYFQIFDPVFIFSAVGIFGLLSWLYFIYRSVLNKFWLSIAAIILLPLLYPLNSPSLFIVLVAKIFAIIGLLIFFPKLKVKQYTLVAIILLASALRLWQLASVPPSLYWDEASLGYNAYSILKTGHDEHGVFMPLTNFAAFGDYKPPLYIYAAVPSIAVFGLNEFAIRFPSALFGILMVILTYFLAKRIFVSEAIAQLSSLFLAISPWHLQFSRGAFEANLGLLLSTLGIYFFIKFVQDSKNLFIFLSMFSFVAGLYTFTGQRLFAPFILLVLAVQFRKQLISKLQIVVPSAVLGLVLFWPLFVFATQTIEGRLRFNEVTIFNDLAPSNQSIEYRKQDNNAWWSSILHNRRLFYAQDYLTHYFDAFKPSFLFSHGDVNPRLSIQETGELYYVDFLFLLLGTYFLLAKKQKYSFLILGWLLASPLGSATARETPHALRMIHILPTFQLIAAFGLYHFYKIVRFRKILIIAVSLALTINFVFYLHMYYMHWPKDYSGEWQYGYRQAVETVMPYYGNVNHIVVTKSLGRPYIYFLLYSKFDARTFWQNGQVVKDKFGFYDVDGFDKFIFTDDPAQIKISGTNIYVSTPSQVIPGSKTIKVIKNLKNEPVFVISIFTS